MEIRSVSTYTFIANPPNLLLGLILLDVRVPEDTGEGHEDAANVLHVDRRAKEDEAEGHDNGQLEVTEHIVRHRRGLANDQEDREVHQEGEGRGDENGEEGEVGGHLGDLGDIVEERDDWNEHQRGDGGLPVEQLVAVALELLLLGADPDLVHARDQESRGRDHRTKEVGLAVGDGRDDDADAGEAEGELDGAREGLAVEEGLNNDEEGGRQNLHNLIKADSVEDEGQVREDDEAAEGDAQRNDLAELHSLVLKEAEATADLKANPREDKVDKRQQRAILEVSVLENNLVGGDDPNRRGGVEEEDERDAVALPRVATGSKRGEGGAGADLIGAAVQIESGRLVRRRGGVGSGAVSHICKSVS